MDTNVPHVYPKLSLEERFYNLDQEERDFFKKETGIKDDEELKTHLIAVQTKAYSVSLYRYKATISLLTVILYRFIAILALGSLSLQGTSGKT